MFFFPRLLFDKLLSVAMDGVFRLFRTNTDEKRCKELSAFAQKHGLIFSPDDPFFLQNQLKQFKLFKNRSSEGLVQNVMQGTADGAEIFLFEFVYDNDSSNWDWPKQQPTEVVNTVFFVQRKDWYLPDFQLKPVGDWWEKLLGKLGVINICHFRDTPAFTEKYQVSGEHETLVKKVMGKALRQFLINKQPLYAEGSNFYMLTFYPNREMTTYELEWFYHDSLGFLKLIRETAHLEQWEKGA